MDQDEVMKSLGRALRASFGDQVPESIDFDGNNPTKIPAFDYLTLQALNAGLRIEEETPADKVMENKHPMVCLFRTRNRRTGEYVTLLCVSTPQDGGARAHHPVAVLSTPHDMCEDFVPPEDGSRLITLRGELLLGKTVGARAAENVTPEEIGNIFAGTGINTGSKKYYH